MKAVHSSLRGHVLKEYPVPSPAANEILIKNVYVASNPKDFKLVEMIPGYETVEGNDTAGYVESVGPGAESKFKVGDKVAAYTKIKGGDQYGTNAEYSVSPACSAFHLGPNTKLEEACTLPLAGMTAALALHRVLGLPSTLPSSDASLENKGVIIYGASTSVGLYAVQLAALASLPILAIAGSTLPSLPSLGVPSSNLIDYRGKSSTQLSQEINILATKLLGPTQPWALFDCVSTPETQVMLGEAMQPAGGLICGVWKPSLDGKGMRENVEVKMVRVGTVHEPSDTEWGEEMFTQFGKWLEDGSLKPNVVKLLPGGLGGIPEGLKLLKAGQVSGEKLVYRVSDTARLS